MAFEACKDDKTGTAKISDIAEYMNVNKSTVKRHIDEGKIFWRNEHGIVGK